MNRAKKYNTVALFKSLKDSLSRTRATFKSRFDEFIGSSGDREDILENLTESLILTDVGLELSEKIIDAVRDKSRKTDDPAALEAHLKREILDILGRYPPEINLNEPQSVIMVVGVNGGGKTTSVAKLAQYVIQSGKPVMLVAADTFRAAAQEQLALWGKRLNAPVIQGQYNADPASVVYDALQSFKAKGFHLLLIDTAGRLHTNINLMNELEKIRRVVSREIPGAPHEILLVLDASIGQNALAQAREFAKFSGITGIFLTKLDGTARGGCVLSIVDELRLPIKFIGLGEAPEDILPFSPDEFVQALLT